MDIKELVLFLNQIYSSGVFGDKKIGDKIITTKEALEFYNNTFNAKEDKICGYSIGRMQHKAKEQLDKLTNPLTGNLYESETIEQPENETNEGSDCRSNSELVNEPSKGKKNKKD